jgi:uncharacterized protein DUF4265
LSEFLVRTNSTMAGQSNMPEHVKIVFQLDPNEQQGYETEKMWAERTGPNEFRILNSPFFVFGVSAEDVVRAAELEEGVYEFQRVVEKGGHSTYRIFLQAETTIDDEAFLVRWARIQALGATYENGNGRFVSVNVRPNSDVRKICGLLEQGESDGVWAFEEANYEGAAGRVP